MIGIEIGDIITTSYGTGPYEVVGIFHNLDEGSFSLSMVAYPCNCRRKKAEFFINGIRLVDGKYIAHSRDEIFVRPPSTPQPRQLSLW